MEYLGTGEYQCDWEHGAYAGRWAYAARGGGALVSESEQGADSSVTILLLELRWNLSKDGEMIQDRGAPLDVPLNSWIDV